MTPASIPSPGFDSIEIGPLDIRMYGVMIAIGVIAAGWLFSRRFIKRGHSPELASSAIVWAVVAGLIGSRIYHVITDWKSYRGNWGEAWQIWEGGLGIPGAVAAGTLAMWVFARRKKIPLSDIADSAAPALPLGQVVGRWGNWFNQELYGRPTDLPWGLEIDPENRVSEYLDDETFHPTFLYEGAWNLALVAVLLLAGRLFKLRPGRLFGLYVLGYALGRLWVETFRVDPSSELAEVRVNIWVMLFLVIVSLTYLLWGRRKAAAVETGPAAPDPEPADDDQAEPTTADDDQAEPDATETATTEDDQIDGENISSGH